MVLLISNATPSQRPLLWSPMNRARWRAKLLEELKLELLQKPKVVVPSQPKNSRRVITHFWKRPKGISFLDDVRRRRSEFVVCLQVHQISSLPQSMDGRALVVGWRASGWKGELTLPVPVREGMAVFDEIFLHCCSADGSDVLKSFTIWTSVVDAGDCGLGTFDVDLSELVSGGGSSEDADKFGGKSLVFELCGIGKGGELSVSVYYRMIDAVRRDPIEDRKESKCKCFPCLPDLKSHRQMVISARRIPSLKSDPGFITMEDFAEKGGGEFMTMEKSHRPPSNTPLYTDDEVESGGAESERPCLFACEEESEVEHVEEEFLRMLDDRSKKESLKSSLDLDMDLECLIRVAEMEMSKAGGRSHGAVLEREEYEELLERWGAMKRLSSSGPSAGFGFGSPI